MNRPLAGAMFVVAWCAAWMAAYPAAHAAAPGLITYTLAQVIDLA